MVSVVAGVDQGKTCFLASLFYTIYHGFFPETWKEFFPYALGDEERRSVEVIRQWRDLIGSGLVPDKTSLALEYPALVHMYGVPGIGNSCLVIYDRAGEHYEREVMVGKSAKFLRRAPAIVLAVRPSKFQDDSEVGVHLKDMVDTLSRGLEKAEANTRPRHLIVMYTAADEMERFFHGPWSHLSSRLSQGTLQDLARPEYADEIMELSSELYDFTAQRFNGRNFIATATGLFRSVDFTLVSALGGKAVEPTDEPTDESVKKKRLGGPVAPLRILDPFLLMLHRGRVRGEL